MYILLNWDYFQNGENLFAFNKDNILEDSSDFVYPMVQIYRQIIQALFSETVIFIFVSSNSVCNHTGDEQIRLPTELDSTQTYYHY